MSDSTTSRALTRDIETMYEADARIGAMLHIPSMAVDPEALPGALERFVDEELEGDTLTAFDEVCPGLRSVVESAWRNYEAGGNVAFRRFDIADRLQRCLQVPYAVCVQYQLSRCISRGKSFPLGSWVGGWGCYANVWVPACSIEVAVRKATALADAYRLGKWNAAPIEPRAKRRGS